MTAEIAVMNKQAIAIAADSAVTITQEKGQKIFTSANKIFSLSKYHPVGIMIYGSASFMQIPWETIIKIYRKQLSNTKYDKISDYADNFLKFIQQNPLFTEEMQDDFATRQIYSYYAKIREDILARMESALRKDKDIKQEEVEKLIIEVITTHHNVWKEATVVPSIPTRSIKRVSQDLSKKYEQTRMDARKEIFESIPINPEQEKQLIEIATWLLIKIPDNVYHNGLSGIVIAGFGELQIFPSLVAYSFEGIIDGFLKYKLDQEANISIKRDAGIIPFAQSEMVYTFMEGVDPEYEDEIERFISVILTQYPSLIFDKIKENLDDEQKVKVKEMIEKTTAPNIDACIDALGKYRNEKNVKSVVKVVAMLPKDQLAEMAETLVNLTSFKRKVTMEAETVGGPVDVAVISKGDGFIWIKRKHYFKPELNPQFFGKYFMEDE